MYSDMVLYLYENIIELSVTENTLYMDSGPMNNNKLVAHRGVDNILTFSIRNRDRKLQNVFNQTLSATIIDMGNNRKVLIKNLEHDSEIGILRLNLLKGELQNIDSGVYKMFVTRTANDRDFPVFSTHNNDVKFDIEITDDTFASPLETQITTTIIRDEAENDRTDVSFRSGTLRGNLDRNFQNPLHTIGIYFTGFEGNIKVQGSCSGTLPESDNDWFNILDVNIEPEETIYHENFELNVNWIRVLGDPANDESDGTIDKVLLRN